uniref:Ras-associating and dilute domain-containing protein n=1 Tax=Schistosoma haematobium TaxID=6185 RepID=A0A095A4E8_SCHHA
MNSTVKIDHETGTHLLNGINWLDSWLRIRRLDKHKRPLNILIQVANLLATPRKQLLKMTWNEMREAYSYIPPALLRFLLEEYEEGFGAQNANSWSIDEKDAAVVDEDPIQSPVIYFRWQELMRGFPPPRVMPQIHINHNHPFNRSTIRNKLAIANRKRLPIRSNNGRMSISPSVMNQNTTLIENSEFSPLPNKTQTSQFDNSMKSIDKTSKFSNDMKPKPSSGEPVWGGSHSSGMNNPQDTSMDSKQKALYYLKGLAASIGGIDLIANANGDQDFLSSESKYSNNLQMGSKVNDYPQENVYHSQVFNRKVTSPHWQNQMLETNRTEIPVSPWYHDPRLQVPNGLSQSLGDFNNGFRPPSNAPSLSRLNMDQLNETANDWKQYRMSLLGQGLDKIRTSKAGSRSVTPRLISNRNVSSSMSNLPINQFKIPDMIIQEAADNISEVVSELDRGRDTDSDAMSSVNLLDINPERELSDVLTRSGLGNSVSNVTLYKEPNSGFGLVLVDGERTSLDQPGIFVKSVAPNSVAEMNGTFRLGDRILAINGRDLTSMTYKDALALLRQCVNQTTFTVLRCNLPDPEALLKRKEI